MVMYVKQTYSRLTLIRELRNLTSDCSLSSPMVAFVSIVRTSNLQNSQEVLERTACPLRL